MTIDKKSFVGSVNGINCTTRNKALEEIGRAFNFPNYYGKNLDALYDCLTDLSWLEYNKVYFVINNKEEFLKSESPETKAVFLDLLKDVKEDWVNNDEKEFTLLYTSKT